LPPPGCDWAIELADFWNSNVERWTSVAATALAKRLGVPGYYVRALPPQILERRDDIIHQVLPIHNRADGDGVPADEAIGTEFLQLVRFGLRDAQDPLILASIRVIVGSPNSETSNVGVGLGQARGLLRCGHIEPSLDELFGDDAIQLLMRRDGVTESEVRVLLTK
jgi:hypothetical protein